MNRPAALSEMAPRKASDRLGLGPVLHQERVAVQLAAGDDPLADQLLQTRVVKRVSALDAQHIFTVGRLEHDRLPLALGAGSELLADHLPGAFHDSPAEK